MTRKTSAAKLHALAERARAVGRAALSEADSKSVLADFGIAIPKGRRIALPEDSRDACAALTAPLAVKGIGPALVHKSDVGAVRLNLQGDEDVRDAIAAIEAAARRQGVALDGYLIEEMAPPGHELIVGGLDDSQFGPVVMLGLGGVFVEVFADVAFRICPIDREDAAAMIESLRAAPLLRGARGGVAAAEDALIDVILCIGGHDGVLMQGAKDLEELDINPLIVSQHGAVAADARLVIRPEAAATAPWADANPDADALRRSFRALFEPSNIAVFGASASRRNRANNLIDQMLAFGFDRKRLFPIHPNAPQINGLKAYSSLRDMPEPIDYGYVAIPAAAVADCLAGAKGRLRFAHVISSGFAEAGRQDLQDALAAAARASGVRVLGPNCNGGHSPRGKFTFCYGASREQGAVGVVLQSGGLGIDTILRGNNRGLRFSGVMTIGNGADLTATDLLEFYLVDPATEVIGMYLEGAADGRRMFDLLRTRQPPKPVVILKGGSSELGQAAALSHTGTLAGDDRIWQALAQQTGVVLARTLDSFIDKLLALQCLSPRPTDPTRHAVLFGNGGGTSVLGVDAFAREQIAVKPFAADTVARLKSLELGPGATYTNPIDAPRPVLIGGEGRDAERVLDIVFEHEHPQAVVLHLNMSVLARQAEPGQDPLTQLLEATERVRRRHPGKAHFLLVLRSDGDIEYEQSKIRYRALALARNLPTFDEIPAAANAVAAIAHHERHLARYGGDIGAIDTGDPPCDTR